MKNLQTIVSKYEERFQKAFPHLTDEKIKATPNSEKDEKSAEFLTIFMRREAARLKAHFRQFAADLVREAFEATKVEERGINHLEEMKWSVEYMEGNGFNNALALVEARQQEFINEQQ